MTQSETDTADIARILPFYVNGTASPAERDRIEVALASDDALRAEAAALAEMRRTWQALPDAEAESSPGEAGLQRLMAQISAEDMPSRVTRDLPAPANTNAPLWARVAALAAAAAFGAVLTATVMQPPAEAPVAEMVSGPVDIFANVPSLTVAFKPEASLSDVTDLLRERGLTVVDGPSAIGLFRLARLDGDAPGLDDAEALRARADLFELVDDPQ